MRRTTVTLLLATLTWAGTTSAADADTPRCVSRAEFDRVAKGMTMTKVHAIFDTAGDETGLGAPDTLYYYDTCSGRGRVQVVYNERDRVVSKGGRFY
ncbi:hypothetical protein GCM10023339_77300 [Alloalcanivorax gelatiniphagus]